jgi:hypothetical protein
MKTDGTPFQVRTGKPVKKDAVPRQPHERDESEDSQESGERDVMKQAYTDIMSGQVDTDLRKQPGVEQTVKDQVKKPAQQPVVPETKKGRT